MRPIFFIILLSIPAVLSLFHPGFFPTHDGDLLLIRFGDFTRSFRDLQIPVRWAQNLNHTFGYPVFILVYPLPLYLWEFIHLLGFGLINSVKISLILSIPLSGIFMYFFLKEKFGEKGAFVAAMLYIYAPFRFVDIYVRGSFGEALSFLFPPLIFWAIDKILLENKKIFPVYLAIFFSGIILTHNIMALIFLPVALFYGLFLILLFGKKKFLRFQLLAVSFFLSLALTAFFWLPAIWEKNQTVFNEFSAKTSRLFYDHFPTVSQLLLPSWGYGPSVAGPTDSLSFQIGLLPGLGIAAAVFSLIYFIARRPQALPGDEAQKTNSPKAKPRIPRALPVVVHLRVIKKNIFSRLFFIFPFSLVSTFLSFFLMLEISKPLWQLLLPAGLIQLPWRLLPLMVFLSAIIGGAVFSLINIKNNFFLFVLALSLIFLNKDYVGPEKFDSRNDDFFLTNEGTTTSANEYMPLWVKEKPENRPPKKIEIQGQGEVKILKQKSNHLSFLVKAETDVFINVNTIFYPGWKLWIDGEERKINYQNSKGTMGFTLKPGTHKAVFNFGETPLRLTADLISLSSLLATVGILRLRRNSATLALKHHDNEFAD